MNKYNNSAKSCYLVNINNENDNEIIKVNKVSQHSQLNNRMIMRFLYMMRFYRRFLIQF
jgi:uncharacterized protein involved in tellurium resistance